MDDKNPRRKSSGIPTSNPKSMSGNGTGIRNNTTTTRATRVNEEHENIFHMDTDEQPNATISSRIHSNSTSNRIPHSISSPSPFSALLSSSPPLTTPTTTSQPRQQPPLLSRSTSSLAMASLSSSPASNTSLSNIPSHHFPVLSSSPSSSSSRHAPYPIVSQLMQKKRQQQHQQQPHALHHPHPHHPHSHQSQSNAMNIMTDDYGEMISKRVADKSFEQKLEDAELSVLMSEMLKVDQKGNASGSSSSNKNESDSSNGKDGGKRMPYIQ